LQGAQIPWAARIFAVVDVWDALRSDRPYRAAWPEAQVRDHLESLAGIHFDPRVVATFLDRAVAAA
jgi:response regulator RpfG family c-di-GMP phosphodiesterase